MADRENPPESAAAPSQARIYDYLLGGHDNLPVDREVADALLETVPITKATAVENRRFLGRAVRFLLAQGIRQFLDIGAGLPTQENVHQIAQQTAPDARVLYVDNDPLVVAHGQSLLANDRYVEMAEGDLRAPAAILALPQARQLLDLRKPIALLLVGVLYFISDDENPSGIVAHLRGALAPGSHVAISHVTRDTLPPEQVREGTRVYNRASSVAMRTRPQIERFFEGFDLVEPGLVLVSHWRPDGPLPPSAETPAMFGAVGRLRVLPVS
jgi:O-methyltransferase involved in polyketide biosynthesis